MLLQLGGILEYYKAKGIRGRARTTNSQPLKKCYTKKY